MIANIEAGWDQLASSEEEIALEWAWRQLKFQAEVQWSREPLLATERDGLPVELGGVERCVVPWSKWE